MLAFKLFARYSDIGLDFLDGWCCWPEVVNSKTGLKRLRGDRATLQGDSEGVPPLRRRARRKGDLARIIQPPCYGREMLFMVIERFKGRDARPVYRRLMESGRHMPEGLRYIDSWIEPNFDRCFQLMETDDLCLLQRWILAWNDLMEFEIVPVVPSKDTRAAVDASTAT